MPALKVQTAPGVWTVVGGQAPGLDQAAADLRYVQLAGDTMTGKLAVHSSFEVKAGSDSPATAFRFYHNTQPIIALYAGTSVNARLSTRLNGPVTLEAVNAAGVELSVGAVSYLTVTPTAVTIPKPTALRVGVPSDFWSASDALSVAGLGLLTTSGGYRVSLSGNGYRNSAGGWTNLASNGLAGSTQIDLDPAGYIMFSASALVPPAGTSIPPPQCRVVGAGFLVGKTTQNTYQTATGFESWSASGQTFVTTNVNGSSLYLAHITGSAADANSQSFARFNRGATMIGSINQVNTTGVIYNATSHGPFKGNVTDIDDDVALARIDTLRPVNFQWKLNAAGDLREDGTPTGDVQWGFIAQELVAVAPEAVSEGAGTEAQHDAWMAARDAYDAAAQARDVDPTVELPPPPGDSPFIPWMTDNSKLVPALVAAVRALIHKVAALEATP